MNNTTLTDILLEIKELRSDMQRLTEDINELKKTTGRMNSHISFVEAVYETVQMPLSFICNKISVISSRSLVPNLINY